MCLSGHRVSNGEATPVEWRLMRRVHAHCHEAIAQACRKSLVPPEFLGALTATESGGNPGVKRFELAVYRHLADVAAGRRAAYGSITSKALQAKLGRVLQPKSEEYHQQFLAPDFTAEYRTALAVASDEALREFATSWGYTQIMGYHLVGRPENVRDLLDPAIHFRIALELLGEFCERYALNPALQFAEMLACWNTGRPHGKTFDPNYLFNGLSRMETYRAVVVAEAEKAKG